MTNTTEQVHPSDNTAGNNTVTTAPEIAGTMVPPLTITTMTNNTKQVHPSDNTTGNIMVATAPNMAVTTAPPPTITTMTNTTKQVHPSDNTAGNNTVTMAPDMAVTTAPPPTITTMTNTTEQVHPSDNTTGNNTGNNTVTTAPDITAAGGDTTSHKSFPRWTVLINEVYYQQRQPNLKNHITFRCNAHKGIGDDSQWMEKKNKEMKHPRRCKGSFELTGWSVDLEPHYVNILMQHECMGTFPSINQIGQFFDHVLEGKANINQRKCDKSNNGYANMLKNFIETTSTKLMTAARNESSILTQSRTYDIEDSDDESIVEFLPDSEGESDNRDLFTIICPPEMIREKFLKTMTYNVPIINAGTRGGWKPLTGGKGKRFHFPDMKTRQPRLYESIQMASSWYIDRIKQWHPEMKIFDMNVLQSSPGAEAQEQLHLDYSTLTQMRPANQQPMSAIIAIEEFQLDIVSCKTTEKLDNVKILPGHMVVFTNKCIHQGGANETDEHKRRVFMYIANVEADIDKNLLQRCHWDAEKKMYVGDEKPKGKVYRTRNNRLTVQS
jgi:hypothetical protein